MLKETRKYKKKLMNLILQEDSSIREFYYYYCFSLSNKLGNNNLIHLNINNIFSKLV